MRIIVVGLSLLIGTMSMASCGEFEVGGKTVTDVFADEAVATLARAAADGDTAAVDREVAAGVNVNAAGLDGAYPLMWALFARNKAGFERLIEHGADPYQQSDRTFNIVEISAGGDDPGFLEILLDHGLDPNAPAGEDQEPPIFSAITHHRWPQFELLLAHCYDLNWANEVGGTAAVEAAAISEMKMAVYLLEQGLSHNMLRLAWAAQGRIGKISEQYEWQQKLISMLRERGVRFPPDRSKKVPVPPPSPPVYAKSCKAKR